MFSTNVVSRTKVFQSGFFSQVLMRVFLVWSFMDTLEQTWLGKVGGGGQDGVSFLYGPNVATASGNQKNQVKLEGVFSVREKSGNLAFFLKSGKNQEILMTQCFLNIIMTIYIVHSQCHLLFYLNYEMQT